MDCELVASFDSATYITMQPLRLCDIVETICRSDVGSSNMQYYVSTSGMPPAAAVVSIYFSLSSAQERLPREWTCH
jgi:hypothetical protein